jgi:hypothetical protein
MKWVLSIFGERLLAVNHLLKYSNVIFISFIKYAVLDFVTVMLVSSANKIGLDLSLMKSDVSFIQRRKSKGSSMDPCGTLCVILPQFEAV